jgi:hypothetical protein
MRAPVPIPLRWPVIFSIWTCVAVALTLQAWATIPAGTMPLTIAWIESQQLARALFWALLTPVVLRLREALPLSGPRRYMHFLAHAGLSVVGLAVFFAWRVPIYLWLAKMEFAWSLLAAGFNPRNLIDIVCYWGIMLGGWLLDQLAESRRRALAEAELREKLAQAELAALRQQVQPHFLFNALNAIAALVRADRRTEAVNMIAQLSSLQRALLEGVGVAQVPLEREIAFVEKYLAVERLRFGERMQVQIEIDPACRHVLVPNLLLQPLVENAVKHGIARRIGPGRVRVVALGHRDRLQLTVCNDPPDDGTPAGEGTGFGLASTRDRLARLYGGRGQLRFQTGHVEGIVVTVELPLAAGPAA